jgi:uncharacterized protein
MERFALGLEPGTSYDSDGGVVFPESARATLQLLLNVPEVQKVILFGSRAIGDHEDRSDFDIAVSAPNMPKTSWSYLRDAVGQSRTLYKVSVSLIEVMPDRLKASVFSQGVVLYERKETHGQPEESD